MRRLVAAALVPLLGLALAGCDDAAEQAGPPPGGAVAAADPAGAGLPDEELAARFGPAAWRVETEGCGWVGSGTAFAVDEHHLVTNHHVVATDVSPDLVSPSGERLEGVVIGSSASSDVAVVETDARLPVTLAWAPTEAIGVGQHLVAFGYPQPALQFTYSWGEVVEALGGGETPAALLTNAPIDRGNSGGPALRPDGAVVGVVTQMGVGGTSDRAAIVFPTATVQPLVAGFIAEPEAVVSDCGLGPDYVPPVPEGLVLPAVLPPPPPGSVATPAAPPTVPVTDAPAGPTRSTVTATTSSVPCPAGAVEVGVRSFAAQPSASPGDWEFIVEVAVTNRTDADLDVTDGAVTVTGTTSSDIHVELLEPIALAPGATATFTVDGAVTSDTEPSLQRLEVGYGWSSPEAGTCPTPPASIEPDTTSG